MKTLFTNTLPQELVKNNVLPKTSGKQNFATLLSGLCAEYSEWINKNRQADNKDI